MRFHARIYDGNLRICSKFKISAHVRVHDNTGISDIKYAGDLHYTPGEGIIDFSVLRELHLDDLYNLEVFSREDVRKGKMILKELQIYYFSTLFMLLYIFMKMLLPDISLSVLTPYVLNRFSRPYIITLELLRFRLWDIAIR